MGQGVRGEHHNEYLLPWRTTRWQQQHGYRPFDKLRVRYDVSEPEPW